MVNNRIVSRYKGSLPQGTGPGARAIAGGPLYPENEVLTVLDQTNTDNLVLWTGKCRDDLQKYGWDIDDARELLRFALKNGRYRGAEWCVQGSNGPWAACDAYSARRREWIEAAHKELDVEYFVKFAIGQTGALLLLVSCHLSEQRR